MHALVPIRKKYFVLAVALFIQPVMANDGLAGKNHLSLKKRVTTYLNISSTSKQPKNNEVKNWQVKVSKLIGSKALFKARELLDFYAPKGEWQFYSRFNLAQAFIKNNQYDNAIGQLDTILKIKRATPTVRLLQEKSSFTLGVIYLRTKQFEIAQESFNKIKLYSPVANKLLWDIGAAWYGQDKPKRALIAWMALQKQGSIDKEVQRAIYAVPLTLEKIGKKKLALVYFDKANNRCSQRINDINLALDQVKQGEFITSLRSLMVKNTRHHLNENILFTDSIITPYIYQQLSQTNTQHVLRVYGEFQYFKKSILAKKTKLLNKISSVKLQIKKSSAYGKELSRSDMINTKAHLLQQHKRLSKALTTVSANKKLNEQEVLNKLDLIENRLAQIQKRLALPKGKKIKSLVILKKELNKLAGKQIEAKKLLIELADAQKQIEKQLLSAVVDNLKQQQINLQKLQQSVRLAQARLADALVISAR